MDRLGHYFQAISGYGTPSALERNLGVTDKQKVSVMRQKGYGEVKEIFSRVGSNVQKRNSRDFRGY